MADLRQKQEQWEEQGKTLLEAQERADQARQASSGAAPRSEQAQGQVPMQHGEQHAARMAHFLEPQDPQRGTRGKALQRNVTANTSAQMQTAHGVMQGDNGPALVDAKHPIILPAAAFGHGQAYGQRAPLIAGATATVQAIGVPAQYCAAKPFRAESHSQSAANRQTGGQAKREASIPDTPLRQRAPRFATPDRHKPPAHEKCT